MKHRKDCELLTVETYGLCTCDFDKRMAMKDGRAIAESVDPNISDDVCTFCRHATTPTELLDAPKCELGFNSYFRSLSNMGPIWVSDCERGELLPEFAAVDTAKCKVFNNIGRTLSLPPERQ